MMVLKKGTYWIGSTEKESIGIYENSDHSFTVFHRKENNDISVLECKGCDLDECLRTANRVFKTYACIDK